VLWRGLAEEETVSSVPHGQRVPNQWGEGERLRQEILDASTRILEESGREDALSLRGIAREVGIAAPSIYLHFKDRTDLIWTVLGMAYTDLVSAMYEAGQAAADTDPWARLRATAGAYRRYAIDNRHRYRLMFSLERQASVDRRRVTEHPLAQVIDAWTNAVDRYLAAAAPERREEAQTLGILLWTGIHGQIVLWHTLPTVYSEDEAILEEREQSLMRGLLRPHG
jgi:AcrR family transcriptional regulator